MKTKTEDWIAELKKEYEEYIKSIHKDEAEEQHLNSC